MYSGGGKSDTLTEDLDLSYRAQLKTGNSNILKMWLPLLNYQPLSVLRDLNSLDGIKEELKTSVKCRSRTQSKSIGLKTKAHGMFHLLNSTMFWRWQS
jgi:hypothetical protein